MTIEEAKKIMSDCSNDSTDSETYKDNLIEILLERKYIVIGYHQIHDRAFLWINLSYREASERIISLKKQGFVYKKIIIYSTFHDHQPWFEIEGGELKEFIGGGRR